MRSDKNLEAAIERIRRRNKILVDLDIAGFKAMCIEFGAQPEAVALMSDNVAVCAMHKSRADIVAIDRELRLESIEWLRTRGYRLYNGRPLPPPGELPE